MSSVALAIVLLSAFLHALWNALAKGSRDPMAFNVIMATASLVVCAPFLPFAGLRTLPESVWLVVGATVGVHTVYFLWLTMAYERGDLSLVYPISRAAPAFVALAAVPLLGESVSAVGAAGIAAVVAGMWLVQTAGVVRWRAFIEPGAAYAYLALASTVAYSLVDKRGMALLAAAPWDRAVPRAVVFYVVITTGYVLLFVPLAWSRLRPGALAAVARHELGRAAGSAVLGFASYTLVLEALRTTPVSYVVAARQVSVLFAVAMGIVWLGERPGLTRVAGALATVAGVALIARAG